MVLAVQGSKPHAGDVPQRLGNKTAVSFLSWYPAISSAPINFLMVLKYVVELIILNKAKQRR